MAQKSCRLKGKTFGAGRPRVPVQGAESLRQNASSLTLANGPAGFLVSATQGKKRWPTDPGFMRPTASSRALIRKPSCATSSPAGRSRRIRWSGPRGWPAGSGPAKFRACCRGGIAPAGDPAVAVRRRAPAVMAAQRIWRRAAVDRFRNLGLHLAQLRASIGLILVIPAPWVLVWYLQVDRSLRARAGAAEPPLHRPAVTIVPGISGRSCSSSCAIVGQLTGIQVLSTICDPGSDRPVLAVPQMVRREPRVQRAAARPRLLRLDLGLFRLEHPAGASPSSPSSAGRGSTPRGCAGFAATSRARGAKSSSTAPGWNISGVRSWSRIALRLHHPDSVGVSLVCRAGSVADSYWSSEALTQRVRTYLRSRTEPSCATDATSVPSGLKIRPRVSPRPPCALGESCA